MPICFCLETIFEDEQAILTNFTNRNLLEGPVLCLCLFPWVKVEKVKKLDVKQNQYVLVRNTMDPSKDRHEYGPKLLKLKDAYEVIGVPSPCPILDQDDYITVSDIHGVKTNHRGPMVYQPKYGDVLSVTKNTIQIPVNCYLVVNDSNNTESPIHHIRGPLKLYPDSFQIVVPDTVNNRIHHACIEITTCTAVHLQTTDGQVKLLSTPQFYMPQVGEKVIKTVTRNVLITTDFAILKSPEGVIHVKDGKELSNRSFFLEPFFDYVTFNCDTVQNILSTLPSFIAHTFNIRTSDNVTLVIDLRISYQIQEVEVFSSNPIDFYPFIRNRIQNDLLDRFSATTLRLFMSTFSTIAQQSIDPMSEYFNKFGISILDVQILNYTCVEQKTQQLLNQDIHTNVNKQNELRARQNDILIQEQSNEVQRKQKDLEVQMAMKDNEVALQKKDLENAIRMKEMEIDIVVETKRSELLSVKRGNDLLEAEFEGKAKGHEIHEFMLGIDENLTADQKMNVFLKQCDVASSLLLYGKVDTIHMLPPNSDLKLFNFKNDDAAPAHTAVIKKK